VWAHAAWLSNQAITRPVSTRTVATVVAWCTSSATYFVVCFMRAAPWLVPCVLVDFMVPPRGVLSISVRPLRGFSEVPNVTSPQRTTAAQEPAG
jgi:hypothetical protein